MSLPDSSSVRYSRITGADNNHDFQNASVSPTVDEAGAPVVPTPDNGVTYDPAPISFTNTLSNPAAANLSGVLLQPIQPSFITGGVDTDLPDGTEVTLTFGTQTTDYTYTITGGVGSFSLNPGSAAITIPTLAPGALVDYTVTVDLPNGTGLSTDGDLATGNAIGGFPVPIIAFVDTNSDGAPDSGDAFNVVVDQVFTGFLRLVKQVRILDGPNGSVVSGMDYTDPDANKRPEPGQVIEYRILYRNISTAQSGSGTNGILNAVSVNIDENGTGINGSPNNWAGFTTNVQNSAIDAAGTITFFTGATGATSAGTIDPGATVTRYVDAVPTVSPTGPDPDITSVNPGDGSFTFQRQVN
ncbi:MAG: hypothetical protein F6K19_17040 [Cyanothece sp. SIO1E1]|nr:hypothetical protein [Cyanothece sp. SIO1E1]